MLFISGDGGVPRRGGGSVTVVAGGGMPRGHGHHLFLIAVILETSPSAS